MVGHFAENIINITDTIFVGRLGEKPLGAVGLGGLYYYTFVLVVIGLAMGVQILIGRRNGEKSFKEIGTITDNALYAFVGIGIVLFGILHAITPALLHWLVKSPDIYSLCLSYVSIRSFGLLFICITVVIRAFYIGITQTRIIIYITTGAALINIFFNQALIFGHLWFSPMGIRGSATASVIAEGCALTGYILYTVFRKNNLKYGLFRFQKPDMGIIRSFLNLGVPIMLQGWISVSSWFVFFIFIEKMGERALSISTIIKSIYIIMMIPLWGLSSATNTLVSNAMGSERTFEVIPIVKKVMGMSIVLMLLVIQVNIFFPEMLLSVFSHSPEVIRDAINPLRLVSAALLALSLGGIMFHAVLGSGSTKVGLYIELITLFVYFAWITACGSIFTRSISWLWASELVYMVCMMVLSFFYLRYGRWREMKI
jgi:putative MATE family efflux protein